MKEKYYFYLDKACLFIASKVVPKRLIYWIIVQVWAVVTSGKYSNKSVDDFNMNETLRRYAEINKL